MEAGEAVSVFSRFFGFDALGARVLRLTLLVPEIVHAILAWTLRKSIPMDMRLVRLYRAFSRECPIKSFFLLSAGRQAFVYIPTLVVVTKSRVQWQQTVEEG